MSHWDSLESPLDAPPRFFVQAPDGRRDWPEIDRQATLFNVMRMAAPRVMGEAIPNAGKRNPWKARKEGIRAGVFDTTWRFRYPLSAHIEMKGYDAKGRPGKLSEEQIRWGNRMVELGHPVACFFCPYAAAEWLREQGFPVAEVRRAA